jgi:hypothetical protein
MFKSPAVHDSLHQDRVHCSPRYCISQALCKQQNTTPQCYELFNCALLGGSSRKWRKVGSRDAVTRITPHTRA